MILFAFGFYGLIVLIFTWIYVKFFEKILKAKVEKSQKSQKEKIQNIIN